MRIFKLLITLIFVSNIIFPNYLTVPEKTNFQKTSLYKDVMEFIYKMKKISPEIKLSTLGYSSEGKKIPLVIISKDKVSSPAHMRSLNMNSILIMANIHAGEVEGKDASLMVIRDIALGKTKGLLDNQVILFIPIFNVDGNDKLGNNRRDDGPELAGVRYNGQHLDLNRDYIKLESPEVNALVGLFNRWDPILFVDIHTTNGSFHREPVTYSTLSNPNSHRLLINYMWQKMFPEVKRILKKEYGTDSIPYGNFVDRANPSRGWRNHAYEARFGTNYIGLRNRFTILDENYSHADFKTRVMSAYYFIHSIIKFTSQKIKEMTEIVKKADIETARNYSSEKHTLTYSTEKLFNFTIKSYEFIKEKINPEDRGKYPPWIKDFIVKKTDKFKDYKLPYFAMAKPEKTVDIPTGYFILPNHEKIIKNLKKHGIIIEKLDQDLFGNFENFMIEKIEYGKMLYQGHILLKVRGKYSPKNQTVPKGSVFISMNQPLARIVSELLEPESRDSLLTWGFFNRELLQQWTRKPGKYPVLRYTGKEENFISVQE